MSRYRVGNITIDKDMANELQSELDIEISPAVYELAYGFDHITMYFVQLFPVNDESDEPALDLDSLFHGLTGIRLLVILEILLPMPSNETKMHMKRMAMDLDF